MTVRRLFQTAVITCLDDRMRNSPYIYIYINLCANILPYKNTSFYMTEVEYPGN
jgi:hypothetical protein